VLEAGAEDFKRAAGIRDYHRTRRDSKSSQQIETKGLRPEVAEVTALPPFSSSCKEQADFRCESLIDALEDHDDVKEVIPMAEFPEEAGKFPVVLFPGAKS